MTQLPVAKLTPKDYKGDLPPVWCPGCGDFGVLAATQRALAERQIAPEDLAFVSGIGCSSRFPHFIKAYGFHSVHGRALPVAIGLKLADPKRQVVVVGGDGDGMAIGAGHFVHAARRNPNITYIMMDNEIYGLTKGQASPTSELGLRTKSTPYTDSNVSSDSPLNPLSLALVGGATWVGRGYSGKIKELTELIGKALDHEGYSFLQVISPCVTFHDIYERARAESKELEPTHDPSDRAAAIAAAMKAPWTTGLFYEEKRRTLEDSMLGINESVKPRADTGLAAIAQQILASA
jgi:2-oxoglutarate/2-oxoacid ferredoxin oxidoreductase subunit beta